MMPLMQLVLLGYSATNDVRNVPLAVIDRDRTPASRQLVEAYRTADYFLVDFDVRQRGRTAAPGQQRQRPRRPDHPAGLRQPAGRRADVAGILRAGRLRPVRRRHGAGQCQGNRRSQIDLTAGDKRRGRRADRGPRRLDRGAYAGLVQSRPDQRLLHDSRLDRPDPAVHDHEPDGQRDRARAASAARSSSWGSRPSVPSS